MASQENNIKENYAKNMKATEYADFLKESFDATPDFLPFYLRFMYNVLKSGRFTGSSVLEIASAAVVHNIASASAFFTNIVMSDYVEDNCNELKKWLQGKSSAQQFLQFPAELEANGRDLKTVQTSIEERIRARVKNVVRCDVFLDGILMEKLPPHSSPPYDLIISSLCAEHIAPDMKSYFQIYKRINKLLRPGGGLLLCGCLRGKTWSVNNIVYHNIEVDQDDLMNALMEAGFGEIEIKTLDKMGTDYEYDKQFCVAATNIM